MLPETGFEGLMRFYRIKNFLVFLFAFASTELGREYYRPYIYANGIRDFRIADTLGNSFGTVCAVFFILAICGKNRPEDYKLILMVSIGLMFYELLQGPMGGAIDPADMLASFLAGVFSLGLFKLLHGHPFNAMFRRKS